MRLLKVTSEFEIYDSRLNYPRHRKGKFVPNSRKLETIITAKDSRGNITFRSVEPRVMTQQEIDAELAKWCIDATRESIDIIIA